jgi:hypothetical protein
MDTIISCQQKEAPAYTPQKVAGASRRNHMTNIVKSRQIFNSRPVKKAGRRTKADEYTNAIRALTWNMVYGIKTSKGVIPSIKKETLLTGGWPRSLSNSDYADHRAGKTTYYYFGNPKRWTRYTLLMVDIDVQKSKKLGTTEGAVRFAEHLCRLWPGSYWEMSTNGNGVHLYLMIDKFGVYAEEVNRIIKGFGHWLQDEADRTQADIELVEVKGTLPEQDYQDGKLVALKYGQFAKLPRGNFTNTATLTLGDIQAKYTATRPAKVREGSASGRIFGHGPDAEYPLAAVPLFAKLFNRLTTVEHLKCNGSKHIVTADDFGIACLILWYCTKNGKADGSLPWARTKKLWESLHQAGDVTRQFNANRWQRVRDFLSQKGFINWIDNRYWYHDDGRKGQCCKYELTEEFMAVLDDIVLDCHTKTATAPTLQTQQGGTLVITQQNTGETKSLFVDTCTIPQGTGEYLWPQFSQQGKYTDEFDHWQAIYEAESTLYEVPGCCPA